MLNFIGPLQYGVQATLASDRALDTETLNLGLTLQSSACIIAISIPELTGDVTVSIYSRIDDGKEVLKTSQTFTTTTQLTQIRVDDLMGEVRLEVVAVATAKLTAKAKAVHSLSETGTGGFDPAVQNPSIQNVLVAIADTEEAIALPANTKKFELKARGTSKLQVAYVSGQSGTTYHTIWPGFCLREEDIDRASLTVYVQASKASEIIEIKSWV